VQNCSEPWKQVPPQNVPGASSAPPGSAGGAPK
jgi:hypothetical protein